MKDVLALIFSLYHKLHAAAPSSDAGKRFMLDMASYAVYSLMSRLTRRGLRPTARDERIDAGMASLIGVGCRSGGAGWLDDQLARVFNSLTSPTRRDKSTAAEKQFANERLSAATKAKAEEIRARLRAGNVESAEKVIDAWDGAERRLRALVTASGAYARGREIEPALIDGRELEGILQRIERAVQEAPAWYLSTGDAVTSVLVEDFAVSDEFADLIGEYEAREEGGWVPPCELGSDDYRDEANMARYHAELDEQYRETVVRTHTV
jgi:hypothetical protein